MRWINLPAWKVALVTGIVVLASVLARGYPMVPFGLGVVGLSWILSGDRDECGEWMNQTWGYAKLVMPLLLGGVLIAGLLLGRPGHEGLVPSAWVERAVGGNTLSANFFASVAGAFMYFATLTEVPILQGLRGAGMGKGPSLALLLAGPALSLPSMLVIASIIGARKTIVYVALVVLLSTAAGLAYGTFF